MCGEKIIEHSRTMDTGAFSEMEIDTWSPKIRQPASFASISPYNRRFNVGGHPKHLFICTWFVCRTLSRFPLFEFDERVMR